MSETRGSGEEGGRAIRVAICLPIYSGANPSFVRSLSRMVFQSTRVNIVDPAGARLGLELETFIFSTSNIGFSRRKLADLALGWGSDWLLWLDADQTFPPDTLARLLSHGKPIIGANYRRRDPGKLLATAYYDEEGREPVVPVGDGIEEVGHLGMAVCLTHASVFRKIGQPYFFDEMLPDGIHASGEDVNFCRKARSFGFPIFVDHGLSRAVGHMSEIELKFPG